MRWTLLCIMVAIALCLPAIAIGQSPIPTPPAPGGGTPSSGAVEATVNDAVESIAARTPIPPPTPGFVQRGVAEFTQTRGLDDVDFLGLSTTEWIDLGLSVLIFVLSYWLVAWFIGRFLRRIVQRTQTQFDDKFFASISQELKWLLGILLLRYSVLRLTSITGDLRTALVDIFFILVLLVLMRITVKLINFGLDWYVSYLNPRKRSAIDPVLVILKNAGKLLVFVTGASIALSHFGLINSAIAIVFLTVGVVVLLSIRDVITDIIYGFIILVGQPFRVGDAIHIQSMDPNDWGWVVDIGSRETRIRLRDNRTLVIPNAALGSDQVVNYMLPDPTFRIQTDLHLAYGIDFDRIQPLLAQATRAVSGVLPDRPVDVMLWRNFRYGYVVRVRCWLANCEKDNEVISSVNAALKSALDAAGVEMGYPSIDVDTYSQPD